MPSAETDIFHHNICNPSKKAAVFPPFVCGDPWKIKLINEISNIWTELFADPIRPGRMPATGTLIHWHNAKHDPGKLKPFPPYHPMFNVKLSH